MEIVYNEQIQEIRQYFQDFSEEEITTLYEKAYREITRRIDQLSNFEDIDQDVIYDDERLVHEIQDSIRNLTLSYIQFERDHQQYGHRYQNIFEFVEQENLSDVFFEQSVTEGHPFHPMTKTKLGFSIDDVIKFSPEFRQTVNVIPLLCNKDFIDEINIYQSPALETFKKKVDTYCKEHGIKFENYALLFIHEWQLKHFLLPQFETCFEQQFMIPLYDLAVESNPLLSFRTLEAQELNCIVKTAVNAQATSAVRNVSPASIRNGIILSDVVERIYRSNGYDNSYIQKDLAGNYLNINQAHANKCSFMLRSRIPEQKGAHQLVCGSLITDSFVSRKPILIECIETIMQTQDMSFDSATQLFLTEYTHNLLEATYRLLLEEGISLEAHMQNSTVIIKDGMPISIYIRDFGGVRLYERNIDIDDSTGLITDSFEDLLSVFSHAVLYNHLFQLIQVLATYGYDSTKGYQIIRNMIADHHVHSAPDINILKQPTFNIKSLLKMRIFSEGYDYQYTNINNPLYMEAK
ncbi:siderophore biosynthesis protein, IucA/IucC family [Mammaliicoccus sciuri]|uniref:IucA/IucC family protein n=1 Tax=Mammaliicoccus sciuri TaxID=1296 RepID=UPI001FB4DD57|nr:IucA/IucC family protein [Mammaliicoccus sciuri]MCJ1749193.1 siderophore biosynthesis protein, IucA/IucC family [Mammaliicoccus sciuri]